MAPRSSPLTCRGSRGLFQSFYADRPSRRRRPAPSRGAGLVHAEPLAHAEAARRRRLRRAALAARPAGSTPSPSCSSSSTTRCAGPASPRPVNPIGIGHCGPILVAHASDEQKAALPLADAAPARSMWCQLFSEPGAGSDLANLGDARRARRRRLRRQRPEDLDVARRSVAKFGILIARTDTRRVEARRHLRTSSSRWTSPGIEVRPIRNMTGEGAGFNEVFFTDVRVPAENLIGEENRGWGDGEDHAGQRAGVAVDGRRSAVGLRPEREGSRRAGARSRRLRRRGAAPAPRRARSSKARSSATTSCA